MSEFSASGVLEITSVNGAQAAIEADIDGVDMGGASASGQLASSAGGGVEQSNTYLSTATDHLDDNLTLNETRNDLLREMLDVQQATAGGGGEGGRFPRPRNLSGGIGGGIAIATAAVAASLASIDWASTISGALPDLNPSDIVTPTGVGVSDILSTGEGSGLPLGAGDLVDSALPVGAAALVASALPLGPGALVASALPVSMSNVVESALPVGAGALVASALPVSASDVVESALPIGAGALVASALPLGVGALLSSAFPLTKGDIVGGESGSGSGSGSGSSSGSGSNAGAKVGAILAATGAGLSGGALSGLSSGALGGSGFASATGGGATAASLGTLGVVGGGILGTALGARELNQVASGGQGVEPAFDYGQDFADSNPDSANQIESAFTNNPIYGAGQTVGDALSGGSESPSVTIENTTNIPSAEATKKDIEREVDKQLSQWERDLKSGLGGF